MSDRLSPQREAQIREQVASAIYPTYGQENRNRSLAIADLIMPTVHESVAVELAMVRAERDEARATLREACAQVAELEDEISGYSAQVSSLKAELATERQRVTRRTDAETVQRPVFHGSWTELTP